MRSGKVLGNMDTKKEKKKIFFVWVLGIAGLFIAFSLGCQIMSIFSSSDRIPPDAEEDFHLMAEAWNAIHAHYVDQAAVKPTPLTYGAISGMVDALGDTGHSTFLTPQMIKEEEELTAGKYKGIGAEIKMKGGHVVIVTPIDGSPAQKAGLKPGEVILEVNGQDITSLNLLQIVKRIAGPEGTKVTLTILSPDTGVTRELTLVRAVITVDNVTWHRLPGTRVAHLRIGGFSEGVTKNLKTSLEEIKQEDLKGLILDLRNDPGGLLKEAISVASQFLSTGNVLLEKNVNGQVTQVPVERNGAALNIPVVGLVNGGTASAAEIVAGALQDHQRAALVGTKTFGTGTVLRKFPLSDGSALLLAVEEWLTPDGSTIWHKGITPTRVVTLPEGVTPLFPEQERGMTSQQLRESNDSQLLDALDMVIRKIGHDLP
jgi:carboxyl-terminal processing protease